LIEELLRDTQTNLLVGADERAAEAVELLAGQYPASQLFGECIAFARYNFVDGWPSHLDALSRVGWFPWVVAENELNIALYQLLLGMYSSVYDNLRRATEITLIGALFVSGRAAREESVGWVMSERPTPFFSRALERLLRERRFQDLDNRTGWADTIHSWYWSLADVTHVRGKDRWINRSVLEKNGMSVPALDSAAAVGAADAYVATVQHLCTILATTNPVLLHGLPLEEKFGLEPPMGGFFNSLQAERLWSLVPGRTRPFFRRLLEVDPDVAAIVGHVEGMPDLTDSQIEAQAADLRRFMKASRRD
jgi:hypothetical protein